MGIQGLLPFLKAYVNKANIREYSGKTVGVDAMCWMHKGAYACSKELVLGQDTDKFVYFFVRHCEILRYANVKPVIVFDGAKLPAKAKEESHRKEVREKAREEALELMDRRSKGEYVPDHLIYAKCEGAIRITSAMISRLMGALRELSIHFLVAPYEADAQLAYMCRIGWVHAVISEDSDLLAYGCPNTFFKMDKYGDGEAITLPCLQPMSVAKKALTTNASASDNKAEQGSIDEKEASHNADQNQTESHESPGKENVDDKHGNSGGRGRGRGRGKAKSKENQDEIGEEEDQVSLLNKWTPDRFVEFCVFCGTDYKEPDVHIKGFGIKTAFKLLCQYRGAEQVINWMQHEKRWKEKLPCPVEEYMHRFRSVVAVFWHHVVFDPRRGECVSIANSYPDINRDLPGIDIKMHCGTGVDKKDVIRIVRGEIDAHTHQKRSQEPLTPAERNVINRIIETKRSDQRQHEHEQQMQADAKRIAEAAAREKADAAASAAKIPAETAGAAQFVASTTLPTQIGQPMPAGAATTDSNGNMDDQAVNEDVAPREMCLLPGDIAAILALQEKVLSNPIGKTSPEIAYSTSPGASADAAHGAELNTPPKMNLTVPSGTSPVQLSNPFARKRISSSVGSDCAVLLKKPRTIGPAPSNRQTKEPSSTQMFGKESSDGIGEDGTRRLALPQVRPRGGHGASDAVAAVLAQRNMAELEPMEESRDRGKLFSFFKRSAKQDVQSKEIPAKVQSIDVDEESKMLSSWQARPWETNDENENPYNVGHNVLSLKSSRRNIFVSNKS